MVVVEEEEEGKDRMGGGKVAFLIYNERRRGDSASSDWSWRANVVMRYSARRVWLRRYLLFPCAGGAGGFRSACNHDNTHVASWMR